MTSGAAPGHGELRVVLVDDEPLARSSMRSALAHDRSVAVVAECPDGHDAVRRIQDLDPDLVLLDVQMPGLDGFQVLDRIPAECRPAVVFVTAYDEHALRAFDIHAVDYVLKPFEDERLRTAVRRARRRSAGAPALDPATLQALLRLARAYEGEATPPGRAVGERTSARAQSDGPRPRGPRGTASRVAVPAGEGHRFIPVGDIDRIEAAGNYVRVHAGGQSHLVRSTLGAFLRRLPRDRFRRVHRSTILNLDRVREVQPFVGGSAIALLADGTRVRVSRRCRGALLRPLS